MNVSSASLTASYPTAPTTTPNAGASSNSPSTVASLLANDAASSSSSSSSPLVPSSSSGGSSPGQDAQKQLKSLSQELLAVMLITDPVQRAKEAADLYKQFSKVAQDYASGSGGGQAPAAAPTAASSDADATSSGDTTDATDTTGAAASTAPDADTSTTPSPTDGTTGDAAATAGDATSAQTPVATPTPVPTTPTSAATPAPVSLVTAVAAPPVQGPALISAWHSDPIMEEIKTFANAAKMVYDTAVQQARRQHSDQTQLNGTVDEMADAKKVLDQAVQDVEGPPEGTVEAYDATGAAAPSTATSASPVLSLTA